MTASTPLLHDSWQSSACFRVRIALALKGVAYRAERYDIIAKAHRTPAFLRLNPQGAVPVLEIDGLVLPQSLAIIEYLDETRPEPRLTPTAPAARARVRALSHVIAMETHAVTNMNVTLDAARLAGDGDQARADWFTRYVRRGFDALEGMLAHPDTGQFCQGDAPSMADCCLAPQALNAERAGLDLDNWPIIARIYRAARAHPAFEAAHPKHITPAAT